VQLDRDPPVDVDELALIKQALAKQLLLASSELAEAGVNILEDDPEHTPENRRPAQTAFALPTVVDLKNSGVAAAEADANSQSLVSSMATVSAARLLTVGTLTTLVEVAALLSSAQGSLAVVCNTSGAAVGVITESLLVHQLGLAQAGAVQSVLTECAQLVMQRHFMTCSPSDSLSRVMAAMHSGGLIHVTVIDAHHRPVGVIYARDGLRALLAASNFEESQLRNCTTA
jgi:CBS domain-containing protein